jgi:hypothetical protein
MNTSESKNDDMAHNQVTTPGPAELAPQGMSFPVSSTMPGIPGIPGWLFVLLWTVIFFIAVTVSDRIIIIGPVLLGVLQWFLLKRFIPTLNVVGWAGLSTLGVVLGPVIGAAVGFAAFGAMILFKQALQLPLGSGAGGNMGALADKEAFIAGALAATVIAGCLMGLCQWFVLRAHVHAAARWIIVSTLSGLMAGVVIGITKLFSPLEFGLTTYGSPLAIAGYALAVLAYAVITGTVLYKWLSTPGKLIAASTVQERELVPSVPSVPALFNSAPVEQGSVSTTVVGTNRPPSRRLYIVGGVLAFMLAVAVWASQNQIFIQDLLNQPVSDKLTVSSGSTAAGVCGEWRSTTGLGSVKLGLGSHAAIRKIAVISAADIWSVVDYAENYEVSKPNYNYQAIIHWNGSAWASIPYERPQGTYFRIKDIYASDSRSVWFAGGAGDEPRRPIIFRWDGDKITSQKLPLGPSTAGQFNGISGSGEDDIWAVGGQHESDDDIAHKGLALHYDGTGWTEGTLPGSQGKVTLTDVRVFGHDSAWASSFAGPTNSFNSESISSEIFNWDGTTWSSVTLPDPPASTCAAPATTRLTSIDGVSSDDVWAVGYCRREGGDPELGHVWISKTLSYHYAPGKWSMVDMPNLYRSQSVYAIGVSPQGKIWLAGQEDVPNRIELSYTYISGGRPVVTLWNDTEWVEVPSIRPYSRVDDIYGTQGFADVGFTEDGRVWAVGHVGKYIFEGFDALVEVFTPCAK